jgi:Fe-S-cluster-containing dehydrogenase component
MQIAMVIDLLKCTGCGACALACKSGNNTRERDPATGQTFNWGDFSIETAGSYPDVRYTARPVTCNHCGNAPCVEVCPVTPKAIFKTLDGLTMTSNERCIGCRLCQAACPYSKEEVEDGEYSVISFNEFNVPTQPYASDRRPLIGNGTASGAEIANKTGADPPHRTRYAHPDSEDVRRAGVVEKCTFCDHRLKKGELPYCVEACPAGARVFGDRDDPDSAVSRLLKKYQAAVLKPEAGTQPNVFYVRSYQATA